MWLPKLVERVEASSAPLLCVGGEEYGVPFLVDGLRQRAAVAWFELGPRTFQDPVAQGNALARAVNATLPSPLLGLALPLRTQLSALRLYRAELQPLWLAVTTANPDERLLAELLDLGHDGYRILIDLRTEPALVGGLAERATVVGPGELRLSLAEAAGLLPGAYTKEEARSLWESSEGRFLPLLTAASRAVGMAPPTVPSPAGEQLPRSDAELVEPALAVQALRREGEYVGALELAVLAAPELVNDLLRQAGPRYQEEGLLERLHLLLSALPEDLPRTERILEWQLVAAFAANDLGQVLPEVDAYLAVHTAPALRARRAGAMRREEGFELARQAADAQPSALTLWQLGRLHPDPATGIALLREAVQLAEEVGFRSEIVRNAGALVARLGQAGEYAEAASWARWTLDLFDRGEVNDGTRRLQVINDLGVARIMTGDLVGLRRVLEDAQAMSEGSLPTLAGLLRSTLAWLELAERRPEAALELLRANYQASPRNWRARHGYQLVRVLLELGHLTEAGQVADDVKRLSRSAQPYEQALASLAELMVCAVRGDPAAEEGLLAVIHDTELVAEQRLMAALYFLLVADGGASRLPPDLAKLLARLHPTGLRVLSGPESRFAPIWATLSGRSSEVTLRFLESPVSAFVEGEEVKLPPRVAEVALALVLNPQGLEREELNAFLTPDGQPPFTAGGMRSLVTRVRGLLPVSDAPYRFVGSASADVLDLRQHLSGSRVREAVTLYRRPLLPMSEAPGVIEERERLEEELRQAVLLSADPDALCELAERLGDDLETWAAAAAALGPNDPRLAVARARVKRLEESYAAP